MQVAALCCRNLRNAGQPWCWFLLGGYLSESSPQHRKLWQEPKNRPRFRIFFEHYSRLKKELRTNTDRQSSSPASVDAVDFILTLDPVTMITAIPADVVVHSVVVQVELDLKHESGNNVIFSTFWESAVSIHAFQCTPVFSDSTIPDHTGLPLYRDFGSQIHSDFNPNENLNS